jgi:hypothetical protein
MAQSDYYVDNGTGAEVRADINAHLEAVVTINAGPTPPAKTFPYMAWVDTTTGREWRRNALNTAWVAPVFGGVDIGKIKARAYRDAAQYIDAELTKVLIDTISFDTEGVVDTTNSRIIPNLPGYYVVMGSVMARAVPDGRQVIAQIYKNGVRETYGTTVNQGADGLLLSRASDLIYMNGTTDYLELRAYNTHSSALALFVGPAAYNHISILGPF